MLRVKLAHYLLASADAHAHRRWERLFSGYVRAVDEATSAQERASRAYAAVKAAEAATPYNQGSA